MILDRHGYPVAERSVVRPIRDHPAFRDGNYTVLAGAGVDLARSLVDQH